MSAEQPTNAETVQDFGLAIFGSEWVVGLGRLTSVNARTMSRIKAAAMDGKDYPAAHGVLATLADTLDALAAKAKPFARGATVVKAERGWAQPIPLAKPVKPKLAPNGAQKTPPARTGKPKDARKAKGWDLNGEPIY